MIGSNLCHQCVSNNVARKDILLTAFPSFHAREYWRILKAVSYFQLSRVRQAAIEIGQNTSSSWQTHNPEHHMHQIFCVSPSKGPNVPVEGCGDTSVITWLHYSPVWLGRKLLYEYKLSSSLNRAKVLHWMAPILSSQRLSPAPAQLAGLLHKFMLMDCALFKHAHNYTNNWIHAK